MIKVSKVSANFGNIKKAIATIPTTELQELINGAKAEDMGAVISVITGNLDNCTQFLILLNNSEATVEEVDSANVDDVLVWLEAVVANNMSNFNAIKDFLAQKVSAIVPQEDSNSNQ